MKKLILIGMCILLLLFTGCDRCSDYCEFVKDKTLIATDRMLGDLLRVCIESGEHCDFFKVNDCHTSELHIFQTPEGDIVCPIPKIEKDCLVNESCYATVFVYSRANIVSTPNEAKNDL